MFIFILCLFCLLYAYNLTYTIIYLAVTGDIHKIDEVLKRVQDMLHAIETVAFDIFDRRYQSGWESTMSRFGHNVALIEETAKQFIDASFHNLRSAEGAFELLQNFKNIKSRFVEKTRGERKRRLMRTFVKCCANILQKSKR